MEHMEPMKKIQEITKERKMIGQHSKITVHKYTDVKGQMGATHALNGLLLLSGMGCYRKRVKNDNVPTYKKGMVIEYQEKSDNLNVVPRISRLMEVGNG